MRTIKIFNDNWTFIMPGKEPVALDLPHTWNGTDGQDGGNDYLRTGCKYKKSFSKPELMAGEVCYIRFDGVNSECTVTVNGSEICAHEGGYSSFFADITGVLKDDNTIEVSVSNKKNDRVYPQKADFTFYGGIYRDVQLIVLPENRFDFGPDASPPLKLNTTVSGADGIITASAYIKGRGEVKISVFAGSEKVAEGTLDAPIRIANVRLWDGRIDPYLYTVKAELLSGGRIADEVSVRTGFRTFKMDPQKGFILNGSPYALRGVCRHQDRPGIGNALKEADHDEDIALIMEVGATTVRLAHYQHDQYFYDKCDEAGLVVWAEIPYISKHMPAANENAYSQMKELIRQNYNHPSIVCWGISNEITISRTSADTLDCHKKLHELCHAEDPSRPTVIACYMPCMITNRLNRVPDMVSYNLYFGWYFPITALAGWKLDNFHRKYPDTPLGLSEYGAEGMPNLHSRFARRMDNTEEYQCIYHEKMLKIINDREYLWGTHLWNMFDFAADARNQGGEPGMNHKGLVTFDRKTKKDAFYLYKAFWSSEKFIHIAGKRFSNRTGARMKVKVYSNCGEVTLSNNGARIGTKKGAGIYEFEIALSEKNAITAECGGITDTAVFHKVQKKDPAYKMRKAGGTSKSWEK